MITNLTDASQISVDGSQGPVFKVVLGGNRTLQNPSNQVGGQTYKFIVCQDSTGGHSLHLDTCYKTSDAQDPELSSAPGSTNTLTFLSDGTSMILTGVTCDSQAVLTAPSGLTASTDQSGQISLSWTNNDSSQTGVRIEVLDENWSTMFGMLVDLSATATSYCDSSLAPGNYHYRLKALRGTKTSKASDSALGTAL